MKFPFSLPQKVFDANRPIFWMLLSIFFVVATIEYFSPNRIFFFISPIVFVAPLVISAVIFFLDPQTPQEKPLSLRFSFSAFLFFTGAFAALLFPKIEAGNAVLKWGLWLMLTVFFAIFAALVLFEEEALRNFFLVWKIHRKKILMTVVILFAVAVFALLGKMAMDPFFRPFSFFQNQ